MRCEEHKQGYTVNMRLKECRACQRTSDDDPKTVQYCSACSERLSVCRVCGKKIPKKNA